MTTEIKPKESATKDALLEGEEETKKQHVVGVGEVKEDEKSDEEKTPLPAQYRQSNERPQSNEDLQYKEDMLALDDALAKGQVPVLAVKKDGGAAIDNKTPAASLTTAAIGSKGSGSKGTGSKKNTSDPHYNPLGDHAAQHGIDVHVEALPQQQQHRIRASVPGAYAESPDQAPLHSLLYAANSIRAHRNGPSPRPQDGLRTSNSRAQSSVPSPPPGSQDGSHVGLVEATPVCNTECLEEAEPVDLNDLYPSNRRGGDDDDAQWGKRSDQLACTPILFIIGLIVTALLGSGLIVYFTTENSNSNTEVATVAPPVNETLITTTAANDTNDDGSLVLNLDLDLPATTLYVLERDTAMESPQAKAYKWVQNDPWLGNYSRDRLLQRFAAATFYYATGGETWKNQGGETELVVWGIGGVTIAPDSARVSGTAAGGAAEEGSGQPNGAGGNSTVSSSAPTRRPDPLLENLEHNVTLEQWLSYTSHECDWYSVPSKQELDQHNLCQNGTFYDLDLTQNNLTGSLPPELSLFHGLFRFNSARNSLMGTLPTEIGMMSRLSSWSSRGSRLRGVIPTELGLLSDNLEVFSVNNNELTGTLPNEFFKLHKLRELRLMDNLFTGTLPDDICFGMPSLTDVKLFRIGLTGTIPSSFNRCTHLFFLGLNDNQFTGTVPSELGGVTRLEMLNLQSNNLSGTVPSELGKLTRLKSFQIQDNEGIFGPLPSELGQLNATLTRLNLKGTSITGTIPWELCSIGKLDFDCSDSLCGCDCPCAPQ
ncbi:Leucine rich repeat N-terminal domain [Seminavis robusta]|uniref:Leucine rich repeat N-terminal domain n=1 Tax=Seminavis robusta TaxID=568900 RepID=A0A9N8HSW9_9STRA|nr:Leucine rich repeat N-terminal domain [Seminavis robusta]|eukprot:Sro1501_g277890.1 Leucine rich repeat N-terminal domain (766) ;mRNA; r:7467-9764